MRIETPLDQPGVEFNTRHREHARPVSADRLTAELEATARAAPSERQRLGHGELRAELIHRLNIGFLLEGLEERGLAVSVLSEQRRPGFLRRKLLFWDPEVGSFEGSLLLPERSGVRPAIVGLHGHRDSDEIFINEFLGARLAREGFVVLLPRFRAFDCSANEARISRALLRSGFTLMGLRVYEVLLMKKYLQWVPQADPDRLGIIGHSGGGSVANLAIWIDGGFRAQVGDHRTDFRDECRHTGPHCETIPAVFPLSADVNDLENLPLAFHGSRYRFEESEDRILEFFHDRLGG